MPKTKPKGLQHPTSTQPVPIDEPTAAEARIAQRLLDARQERPKPPCLTFTREENALEIGFEGLDARRAMLQMHGVTGLANVDAVNMLIDQLACLNASDFEKHKTSNVNSAIAMMDELKPTDGQEAMLAAQMVAVHVASMQCFSRALLDGQTFAERELNLKHGAKLSRIYAQQVEALDKHRRKGQQTVIVEHVHVNEGGQAIVGNVSTGRGV